MVRTWSHENSAGLLGGVFDGRGEVGAFGTTTSVGAMVLAMEQFPMKKIFRAIGIDVFASTSTLL